MKSNSKTWNSHYGGDEIDKADDESQKLYINDCHRRQSSLYPSFAFKSPAVRMLLGTPDPAELLAVSGQSRMHLHLQQMKAYRDSNHSNLTALQKPDFILFTVTDNVFPNFPSTLEEEATVFRKHGLPLLVWPATSKVEVVQQFLDEHYPDCAIWFIELIKVSEWLNKKWKPLAENLGISSINSVSQTTPSDRLKIQGFHKDSVAVAYTSQRLKFYENYAARLQDYLIHRRMYTPAFHFNAIHQELQELAETRKKTLKDDSGFFNVIGNRLLELFNKTTTPTRLNVNEFVKSIDDPVMREQCLQSLLSAKDLKLYLRKRESQAQDESDRENSQSSESEKDLLSSDDNEELVDDTDTNVETSKSDVYPNRPITKEIMENRGLVKYRHKRERNPRVHLRHKFRKATIRYRSRAPPVRHEETPYSGEARGIRVHLVKSHKFRTK